MISGYNFDEMIYFWSVLKCIFANICLITTFFSVEIHFGKANYLYSFYFDKILSC